MVPKGAGRGLLVVVLAIAVFLNGCAAPARPIHDPSDSDLSRQLVDPAHSEPTPQSFWADHPELKTTLIIVSALAGVVVIGTVALTARSKNPLPPGL
jgi:hypothetical protein